MICTVTCQEIEAVKFLALFHLCLCLNYVNQTTKSNLSKNYYQTRIPGFPKENTNFLPPQESFSSLITKRVVLTLTL